MSSPTAASGKAVLIGSWFKGMGNRFWQTFTIMLFFAATGAVCAAERPTVREVVTSQVGNGVRIEIRANLPLTYKSYLMPELAKWVIDLPGAKTDYPEDESKKMRLPPLERITVRQKEVNGDLFTRIGLDFKGEVDFSVTADPLDKGRLVVLLTPSTTTVQKPPADATASTAPQPHPNSQQGTTGSAAPSAAPPDSGVAAKTVTSVRITTDYIRIEADGKVTVPKSFMLTKPGRLVLDLTGVTSTVQNIPVPAANRFAIVRSRLGKSAEKLRIVFEVSEDTFPDFQLKEILNGVEIIPGTGVKRK